MFETVSYEVAGRSFSGILATPQRPGAGVLMFHGGGGVGEHERDRIRMLAALGYTAFAPDLFGEVLTDRARGMALVGELLAQPAQLRARTNAALLFLTSRNVTRVAAIGHCFGGFAALELARSGADIIVAVSFHGRLATNEPARRGEIRARVLACTGAEDSFCPREQRVAFEDEMTAAGVDWQHHVYGDAKHGFSVPGIDPAKHPGCAYHELADRRSWGTMLRLLAEAGI